MIGGLAAAALVPFAGSSGGNVDRLRPLPKEGETPQPTATSVSVKTYPGEPALALDPSRQYFAVIKTAKGDIRLELFDDLAPRAVNSFLFLAQEGFYTGLTFYRVLPNFVAQAGDPTCDANAQFGCTGTGGPGYLLPLEENGQLTHVQGAVAFAAVAGSSSTTSGSQFYLLLSDSPTLNGEDTVFGRIVAGLDVAQKFIQRNPCFEASSSQNPCEESPPLGDQILSVSVEVV